MDLRPPQPHGSQSAAAPITSTLRSDEAGFGSLSHAWKLLRGRGGDGLNAAAVATATVSGHLTQSSRRSERRRVREGAQARSLSSGEGPHPAGVTC